MEGLLGRDIEWVIADGKSDWPTFASEAQRLIEQEKVSVIFGCWTSASRRSVKPVVERNSHLLIYPMAYEGLEDSANIVYTGAAPNQQVIPAVSWCFEALKARKFFLVGSDYVWPHCVNEIIKDELKAMGAECVGESYILFGSTAVGPAVEAIRKASPDVIISTVVGDSNEPFYQRLHAAGVPPGAHAGRIVQRRGRRAAQAAGHRRWLGIMQPGTTSRRSTGRRIRSSSGGFRRSMAPNASPAT